MGIIDGIGNVAGKIWNGFAKGCTAIGPVLPVATLAITIWANKKNMDLQTMMAASNLKVNELTIKEKEEREGTGDIGLISMAMQTVKSECFMNGNKTNDEKGREYVAEQVKKIVTYDEEDDDYKRKLEYWTDVIMGRK